MVALITLSCTTILGILSTRTATTARALDQRIVRQLVHRSTALLGVLALATHITLAVADKYASVSVVGAMIPFAAGYRPVAVGVGTIATYILIAVALSGLTRARFASSRTGLAVWRAVHVMAYVGWVLAIGHGIFAGSDSNTGWALMTYIACAVSVIGTAAWRFMAPQPRRYRDWRGHRRLIATGGHQ
jgi:sulfoxide reductase heme-binding subunit YedZ